MRLTTKGRETQIYHKEQGQWRFVYVYYSGMTIPGKCNILGSAIRRLRRGTPGF